MNLQIIDESWEHKLHIGLMLSIIGVESYEDLYTSFFEILGTLFGSLKSALNI